MDAAKSPGLGSACTYMLNSYTLAATPPQCPQCRRSVLSPLTLICYPVKARFNNRREVPLLARYLAAFPTVGHLLIFLLRCFQIDGKHRP